MNNCDGGGDKKHKYIIKVKNPHWLQIRYLMKEGFVFIEKNIEKSYYIVVNEYSLEDMKVLEKCNWIDSVQEVIDIQSSTTDKLSFDKICLNTKNEIE